MFKSYNKSLRKANINSKRIKDLDPDEIFIDAENLPKFDVHQFEGRIEKPISARTFFFTGIVFLAIFVIFIVRVWYLQVEKGSEYFNRSENNRLRETLVFAKRGVISDRNGEKIAWNVFDKSNPEFAKREYKNVSGLSHLLGYLKYPSKDSSGFYYSEAFIGKAGAEQFYDSVLSGKNGERLVEINALGNIQSESVVRLPEDGKDIVLSVDYKLQNKMYSSIESLCKDEGYVGGAGVIMDINTGEILSMASYPEYNSQVLTDGQDKNLINSYLKNKNTPFIDRVTDGLYTPGSIVKPFMAIAALSEKIIGQYDNILSTGSISLPNPYDPSHPSVFKDWKAHGYVDMRHAISVSSDVYFYEVGGGFENQKGLGIQNINKYMKMFGFGSSTDGFFKGVDGTVPDPEWKKENFDGEDWRIGDTYHTSIGQYGFQVSPIQAVIAVASIANSGKIIEPTILLGDRKQNIRTLSLDQSYFEIVRDAMRLTAEEGTAKGLFYNDFRVGAKTGTAQVGAQKQYINAWAVGFFPYKNPKYAFALIMERGPADSILGGVYPMRQTFDWMLANRPEYTK